MLDMLHQKHLDAFDNVENHDDMHFNVDIDRYYSLDIDLQPRRKY